MTVIVTFELEIDEAMALMQCASVGASAAQVLLGSQARQMAPIFNKIQRQFAEQTLPQPAANGNGASIAP